MSEVFGILLILVLVLVVFVVIPTLWIHDHAKKHGNDVALWTGAMLFASLFLGIFGILLVAVLYLTVGIE